MTRDKVDNLLNPNDPQDVPRAVSLIQNITALGSPDFTVMSPSNAKTHRALCLLGEVLRQWLLPFIDINMDLSTHIRYLVCYSHLIYYLYRRSRTSFMTSQLYVDSQSIVKNIVFCVAKQQLLAPSEPFYIIQVKSDQLEGIFADVRTQNHSRNCDVLELSRKLAVSSMINSLMIKHPEWDRG